MKRIFPLILMLSGLPLLAETATPPVSEEMFTVNNLWLIVATALVFIMHLGFSCLEVGLTRAKNTVNILTKNVLIVAIGLITYYLIGFGLMYPGDAGTWNGILGFAGAMQQAPEGAAGLINYADGNYTFWTDFLFQGMFAATAATIVSGAVAERIKLGPFLIFSAIYVAIVYPIIGSWHWGSGWLSALETPFHDFAGSTIVHAVGGWGALAGVIVLGPRLGKYVGKTIRPIMGHNIPLAAIGAFLLWFGWFGFNGGSVLSADAGAVSFVLVTTSMAAAAGVFTATMASWIIQKKPDLTMLLNGALAGLVGITAGADKVTVNESLIIGAIAGALVVLSVLAFDKLKLDDPVGALSVHLVCGIWGTLATGIWGEGCSFLSQLIGTLASGLIAFPIALGLFVVLKKTVGIRVSQEEEMLGLDIGEHGMEAYSGFQIFTNM